MKKVITAVFIFIAGAAACLILTHGTLRAQGADTDMAAKLDDIVKSQQEIKAALNDIKEDLKIIKLRVTTLQ